MWCREQRLLAETRIKHTHMYYIPASLIAKKKVECNYMLHENMNGKFAMNWNPLGIEHWDVEKVD